MTRDEHIDRTIDLAGEAVAAGNTPFGALLAVDGAVVRESQNTTPTAEDVTAHPGLKPARVAGRELDAGQLTECPT